MHHTVPEFAQLTLLPFQIVAYHNVSEVTFWNIQLCFYNSKQD